MQLVAKFNKILHGVRMKTTKILSFIRAVVINVSALLEQPHYPLGSSQFSFN